MDLREALEIIDEEYWRYAERLIDDPEKRKLLRRYQLNQHFGIRAVVAPKPFPQIGWMYTEDVQPGTVQLLEAGFPTEVANAVFDVPPHHRILSNSLFGVKESRVIAYTKCGWKNVRIVIGPDCSLIQFNDCDYELKAPGVSAWSIEIPYAEFHTGKYVDALLNPEALRDRGRDAFLEDYPDLLAQLDSAHWVERDWQRKMRRLRAVLVLGSFSDDRMPILATIKRHLQELGYSGFTADEVPDPPGRALSDKILHLAIGSEFVVVDDSVPSGHLAELQSLSQHQVPLAILVQEGLQSSFMATGVGVHRAHIRTFDEFDPNDLRPTIAAVVQWATRLQTKQESAYRKIYPWQEDQA